jgi:hypothetical protein
VRRLTLAPARRAHLLRVAAAAALLAGYADLVVGGTSAAPILLVIGYVALVPSALLAD